MTRASQQMKTNVENAKICCLDFSLSKFRLPVGISIECRDATKIGNIRTEE